MINIELWNKLERVSYTENLTKAYLLRLEGNQETWQFLLPPDKIRINGSNTFRENFAMFGKGGFIRYSNSNFARVSIDGVVFMTPGLQRSMLSVEQGLDNLRYSDPEKLEPSKLSLVYGKRSIQPLQLESYDLIEEIHQNGYPLAVTINLNFIAVDRLNLLGNA